MLAAFEKRAPNDVTIEGTGCLGHCGSGPTVLILPENEWRLQVQPKDADGLINQHFEKSRAELGAQSSANQSGANQSGANQSGANQSDANKVFRIWLWVIGCTMVGIAIATWLITKNSYYI